MSRKYGTPIDLLQNELQNAVIWNLSSPPAEPSPGLSYYDTTKHLFGYWNGTEWIYNSAYILPEATASVLGGIELNEDLGGTATHPKVVNLHLSGNTAINHKLTELSATNRSQRRN